MALALANPVIRAARPLLLAAALCRCAADPPTRANDPDASAADASSEPEPDAGAPDAAAPDAGPELPVLPPAGTLPLVESDVLRVGADERIDVTSAVLGGPDGGFVLVFETLSVDGTSGDLSWARSPDGHHLTLAETLTFVDAPLVLGPSAVGGELYFMSGETLSASPRLQRSTFDGQGFTPPVDLPRIDGVASLLSWPRFGALPTGGVGVAFRDAQSRPSFAVGDDASFDAPAVLGPFGAMAAFGTFASGTVAFTYQVSTAQEPMVSYVRISSDLAQWSEAERVTENSSVVHDTFVFRRSDGDVDLYYIYPAGGRGFSIFRRHLSEDGALGSEEQVTDVTLGDPSKPAVERLAKGELLLSFADITRRGAGGEPVTQQLAVAVLGNDAP